MKTVLFLLVNCQTKKLFMLPKGNGGVLNNVLAPELGTFSKHSTLIFKMGGVDPKHIRASQIQLEHHTDGARRESQNNSARTHINLNLYRPYQYPKRP